MRPKLIIGLVIALCLLAIPVSAILCYQESPIISNQSGTDGSCGLNYSGSSILSSSDWFGWLNETYIKPAGADSSSQLRIRAGKPGMLGDQYISIPASCWNYDAQKLYIQLKSAKQWNSYSRSWIDCYNGTDWQIMFSDSGGGTTEEQSGQGGIEWSDGNWSTWSWYETWNPRRFMSIYPGYNYASNDTMSGVIWEDAVRWSVCVPSWNCTLYGNCNTSDLETCMLVEDLSNCSLNYTGNYSEFGTQACDYCLPSFSCSFSSFDCQEHQKQCLNVTDANGCYAETSLSSDEFDGNLTPYAMECGYLAQYNTSDLRDITGDVGGNALMELLNNITMIVAIGVAIYAVKVVNDKIKEKDNLQ